MYYSGADFSKQSWIIKSSVTVLFTCWVTAILNSLTCCDVWHYISRSIVQDLFTSVCWMFDALMHLSGKTVAYCSRRLNVRDKQTGRSRSGLVTFHWRQQQHTVTFQLRVLRWGDTCCRASRDSRDRTLCVCLCGTLKSKQWWQRCLLVCLSVWLQWSISSAVKVGGQISKSYERLFQIYFSL